MKANKFKKMDACGSKTSFSGSTAMTRSIAEAVAWKDWCKAVLKWHYDPEDEEGIEPMRLEDTIELAAASYPDEVCDKNPKTQASYARQLGGQMYRFARYVRDELPASTIPFFLEEPIVMDISSLVKSEFEGCDEIESTMDVILCDPSTGLIDGITFKRGVPKITQNKGADCVDNNIELHLNLLLVRKWAKAHIDDLKAIGFDIEDGKEFVLPVSASFYYSKKSSDTTDPRKTTYFDSYSETSGRGSIPEAVRMLALAWDINGEIFQKGFTDDATGIHVPTVDSTLIDLLDQFQGGYTKEDMNEEHDCKGCPSYDICYYKLAPVPITEEEVEIKVRKKCTLSAEQEEVVNFGRTPSDNVQIGIVEAGPGSGKTETAQERMVQIVKDEVAALKARVESGTITEKELEEWLTPNRPFLTKTAERCDPNAN